MLKSDFVEYAEQIGESKPAPNTRLVWKRALAHLKAFAGPGGQIPFTAVNEALLTEFKDYLLARVRGSHRRWKRAEAGPHSTRPRLHSKQRTKLREHVLRRSQLWAVFVKCEAPT
jgi:hypothetical protein